MIGIYFTVYISKKFGFYQDILSYYTLVLAKMICMFSVTYLMRRIVRKRMVKDQTELHIRGMVLVPLFSMVLIYLYCISGGKLFSGARILGCDSLYDPFAGYQYLLSVCVV